VGGTPVGDLACLEHSNIVHLLQLERNLCDITLIY
jgi:hypothetical protein